MGNEASSMEVAATAMKGNQADQDKRMEHMQEMIEAMHKEMLKKENQDEVIPKDLIKTQTMNPHAQQFMAQYPYSQNPYQSYNPYGQYTQQPVQPYSYPTQRNPSSTDWLSGLI